MINEALMATGSWSLTLRPETPWEQVKALGDNLLDHVAITPVRLSGSPSSSTVLSKARFTGRLDLWDPGERGTPAKIGGPGIAVWMGDQDGKGEFFLGGSGLVLVGSSMASFLTTYFTAARANGLTLGSTYSLPTGAGNVITYSANEHTTLRKVVDDVRVMMDTEVEWRVKPNGATDFAAAGATGVFVQTPTVVISKDLQDFDGSYTMLQATTLRYSRDAAAFATEVDVYESTDITYSASSSRSAPKGFDGSTAAKLRKWESSSSTSATNKGYQAAMILARQNTQYRFDVAVRVVDIGAHLIPGDYVYLYNPENGLYDTSNKVQAGREIHPLKVRCVGVSWPVQAGMGVYRIASQGGTNTVTDLTDYVLMETGDTKLTIGDLPPLLGLRVGR